MDLLKAELERKRRACGDNSNSGKKKKYLTAAERRRLEEEEEDREEEIRRAERKKRKRKKRSRHNNNDSDDDEKEEEDLTTLLTKKYDPKKKKSDSAAAAEAAGNKNNQDKAGAGGDGGDAKENVSDAGKFDNGTIADSLKNLSPDDVTNTLRRFGLPIRLFGERTLIPGDGGGKTDDTARLQRLSIAMQGREAAMLRENEDDEYLLDQQNRSRNVFLEKHHEEEDMDNDNKSPTKASKSDASGGKTSSTTAAAATPALTEEELNDKPKRIYRYFKNLIRQWEEDLALRPDAIKKTAAGKNETKTLKQCKDYIRPLFKECKRRELDDSLQTHLFNIVTYCEQGEFVKAHDSYMDVAIGRAAWPIGVTMVGIHARSGRAKIESSNVAHVMNSEMHRKYLTSVKRLMRYDQNKRTDVNPSKKVQNL